MADETKPEDDIATELRDLAAGLREHAAALRRARQPGRSAFILRCCGYMEAGAAEIERHRAAGLEVDE